MMENNPNISSEGYVDESVVRDIFNNPRNVWDSEYIELIAREVLISRNRIPKLEAENKWLRELVNEYVCLGLYIAATATLNESEDE